MYSLHRNEKNAGRKINCLSSSTL